VARVYYERLSDESASYLQGETSRQRAHTAMTLVFDAGPLATEDGGVRFDRIREVVEARLAELPRLRCKLRRVPTEGHPVWVDDAEFNLDYHLRQSSLPRPGNAEQLARTTARVAAGRLDRSRPLWDCWVIEGLENGRFALVVKMHKALTVEDGSDLIRALLSATEEPSIVSVRAFRARPAPSPIELFASEVLGRWSPSRRILSRAFGALADPTGTVRRARTDARNLLQAMGYALRPATESPFDGRLGPHRSYEMQAVPLDLVQDVHRSLGGSIHDVVLALVAGSLRRFLEDRLVSPVTVDLRALTPVLDSRGDVASPWTIELPIWERDPAERVRLIRDQTRRIRSEEDVVSGEKLVSGDEWNASGLFLIGARALHGIDPGQIAVLQAPGPRKPLFLEGARLEACYGFLPLQDSSALGVTAVSYAGSLFLAFNADSDIVPDLDRLHSAVDAEMEALVSAATEQPRTLRAVSA
jgi:diacylglycerol O-acyltransferase